jgi:hypothetical protein
VIGAYRVKPTTWEANSTAREEEMTKHQTRPKEMDHSQQSMPSMRRRPGAQPELHLRRKRTHLRAYDLHHLWRNRTMKATVPDFFASTVTGL